MNRQQKRIKAARAALAHYAEVKGGYEWEHDQTRLADLLADMMHAADAKGRSGRLDFEAALFTARGNYTAETK